LEVPVALDNAVDASPTWRERYDELERQSNGDIAAKDKLLALKEQRITELSKRVRKLEAAAAHRWPWGDYETSLLTKLADAAKQWWSTYDREMPTTAPRNKEVADWLIEQHDVSPRVAQIMAQVLRADGLRTGRREK